MKKSFRKKNKGFMMVEVVVATSIILISVLASMSVVQKSIVVSRQSLHTTQAAFLLEEGAEAVRINRDNSWTDISNLTNGTSYYPTFSSGSWVLFASPTTIGIFTRTVTIQNVNRNVSTGDIASSGTNDPGTKLVTVNVSWKEGANTITKTLSFYIADIFS